MKKGDQVRFVRKPENPTFHQHFELSTEYIDVGKKYVIEHVFAGNPQQLELAGIETMLFAADMFDLIDE
jgi:hypothetical protein